jgi:hypothetical protein
MAFWAKLKSTISGAWVDRTRLKIADHDKISFFIKDEAREIQKLNVQNISVGGIGLLREDFPNADLSRNIEAELRIVSTSKNDHTPNSSTFKIRATIVHISEKTVGLRFDMVTPEFEIALEQYFKAELLGSRLNMVDKKYLKAENNIFPTWLTDGRANEIYILADKSDVLSFHLAFLGHYIEGEKNKKLQVGQIADSSDSGKMNRYKESDIIAMAPKAQETSLRLARDFVLNAKGIEPVLIEQILSMLKV